MNNPITQNKNNPFNKVEYQQEGNLEVCQICKSPEITYLDCIHLICTKCFTTEAERDLPNMKCKICNSPINEQYKKEILGENKYESLVKKFNELLFGNLIECPNCHEMNSFEKGKVDFNVRDDQNNKLSREAAIDYAENRCRCGSCGKNFCAKCKKTPYHIGMTCEQSALHEKAKKCKYCTNEIKGNNKGPQDDVCKSQDCLERYKLSCKKTLPCGHKCYGVNSETKCPPCLNNECPSFKPIFDQDADSYCNICYTEGLGNAPIVLLSCNHYVHYSCIKKRLEGRWVGPKITFNHCLCPACNKWYNCPQVPELQNLINENKKLYDEICDMSLKRLKFEELDKDPKLTDPNSKWYGQKLEYALKRLSYYMCYICKKPYFAGRRECGDGPNVNNDNPNKVYDPKDCVCGKDANLSGVAGITDCKKHGKDFIEYKCRFCCKIASWFCWGTTHFCEDCHARQCRGDYISKYPKDKLPKCNSKTCEVGGKHPPNGEEYALGCSICRNNEENYRSDF